MKRALFGLLILAGFPPAVMAQNNLSVEVHVSRVSARGDTVRIEYQVRNAPDSREELWDFTVDAPSPVIRIQQPRPGKNWDTATVSKTISVASWASLGTHTAPGAMTPPLVFEAVGLPGIVTYWAMGWFPVPQYDPEEPEPPPMSPREAISADRIQGRTVGVDSLPSNRSPAALLRRMEGLLDATCNDLGWIRSSALCGRLRTKLEQAQQALARGRPGTTEAQLVGFLEELAPLSGAAFWLVKANAEYVLGQVRLQR